MKKGDIIMRLKELGQPGAKWKVPIGDLRSQLYDALTASSNGDDEDDDTSTSSGSVISRPRPRLNLRPRPPPSDSLDKGPPLPPYVPRNSSHQDLVNFEKLPGSYYFF